MNKDLNKFIKDLSCGSVKYQNPKKLNKNHIDKKLRKSIHNINKSNWCYTIWSCQGHIHDDNSKSNPYITFIVKNEHIGVFFSYVQTTLMPYKNKKFPILGNGNLLINKGYGNNKYTTFSVYWSLDYLEEKTFRYHFLRSLNQVSRKIKSYDGK